jgi:hypothetical protein
LSIYEWKLDFNLVESSSDNGINIEDSDSVNNKFENNNLINSKVAGQEEEGAGEGEGEEEDD